MPSPSKDTVKQNPFFDVSRAYGEPIDVDGVQVTPVAIACSGYGSGTDGDSEGAGGGGVAIPVGVYVRREEGLRFEPNFITLLVVGIPFLWVAGRAVARVIRALKK